MKKILSAIVFLTSSMLALAGPVSPSEAMEYARVFFGTPELRLVQNDGNAAVKSAALPSYYVFNNPEGGWIIIAADNVSRPVLGYSMTGSFKSEGMPSNVRLWMERYVNGITKARSLEKQPSEAVKAEWKNAMTRTRANNDKLIQTALWDQTSPYNTLCPKDGTKASYTGCVATAMAIVLRYHGYPEHGNGIVPAYRTDTKRISVPANDINSHYYNLSAIPMTDGYNNPTWTSTQKSNVAQLMYDCGTMVEMDYTSDEGSAAWSDSIIPALNKYMGYNASARELYRAHYTSDEWLAMIKAEIDSDRPLIYGGSTRNEEGHQFVIDGYDASGNLHVNWGWGGEDNGYFAMTFLGSSADDAFSCDDSGIFGLSPDPSGSTKAEAELVIAADSVTDCGIMLAGGSIRKGSTFSINVKSILDFNNVTYSGAVRAALVDKDDTIKEYIGTERAISITASTNDYLAGIDLTGYNCTITEDILPGDGIVILYRKNDGSWERMGKLGESYYECPTVDRMGVIDVPFIKVSSTYSSGKNCYFSLLPGWKPVEKIAWSWDGDANEKEYVSLTSGTHVIKAEVTFADKSTATISQKISVK